MSFFAKNLRFLRTSRRLSQEAFAKAVDLNRGNIASYEKGLAEPNSVKLLRIARFFNVPLEAMIEEELALSGKDFSLAGTQIQKPKPNAEELIALKAEAERLGRIMDGLKEFHLLRQQSEEVSPQNMRNLQVDYERLIDSASKMQSILQELVEIYL